MNLFFKCWMLNDFRIAPSRSYIILLLHCIHNTIISGPGVALSISWLLRCPQLGQTEEMWRLNEIEERI